MSTPRGKSVKKKFRELLHAYRVQAFKAAHADDSVDDATQEILSLTGEALNNAYKFHFHKDPDPEHIETFNLIKNYTLEALLPPVVEKIMRRVSNLEKQHGALVALVDQILEELSEDDSAERKDAS
jgi:hypothetical protein